MQQRELHGTEDVMSLIQKQQIPGLTKWYNAGGKEELESIPGLVPEEKVVYGPLYRNPKRIFGIGLNYADHAGDIGSAARRDFREASSNRQTP